MPYRYIITRRAAKDIEKLDTMIKRRLKTKLEFFIAQKDPLAHAKTLVTKDYGSYRWRIGDYRIIFDVDGDKLVILQVQHRREVYRR